MDNYNKKTTTKKCYDININCGLCIGGELDKYDLITKINHEGNKIR